MQRQPTRPKFRRKDEIDLLRTATEAIPSDFPNPERLSCPEASKLEAIAGRRLSLPDINDVVDHIAMCSPCFAAYSVYRKSQRSRYLLRRAAQVTAFLMLAIAAVYLGGKVFSPTQRFPEQRSDFGPLTAVLDFHELTSERSDHASTPGPRQLDHLRRSLLNLQIRLPLGTEDGEYSLQFRNSAGGMAVQTTGVAKWDGTTETLSAPIDLRTVEPGPYTLALRKGASTWRQYSVFVD